MGAVALAERKPEPHSTGESDRPVPMENGFVLRQPGYPCQPGNDLKILNERRG